MASVAAAWWWWCCRCWLMLPPLLLLLLDVCQPSHARHSSHSSPIPFPTRAGRLEPHVGSLPIFKLIFMASTERIAQLRPAAEQQFAGRASLTTAIPGMLEVRGHCGGRGWVAQGGAGLEQPGCTPQLEKECLCGAALRPTSAAVQLCAALATGLPATQLLAAATLPRKQHLTRPHQPSACCRCCRWAAAREQEWSGC